jgi:phosphoribosylformylglycinamidine synthase
LQGTAIAIGEQPIKGLLSPAAMGRLCVGEMLTNLVAAPVSSIRDIKVRLRPHSSRLRCG